MLIILTTLLLLQICDSSTYTDDSVKIFPYRKFPLYVDKKRSIVSKCCELDQVVKNDTDSYTGCEQSIKKHNFNPKFETTDSKPYKLTVIVGLRCEITHLFSPGGTFIVPNGSLFFDSEEYRIGEYCIDRVGTDDTIQHFICGSISPPEAIYVAGVCVSVPFIFLTFFIYMFVEKLHSLYTKILLNYVGFLSITFLTITFKDLVQTVNDHNCKMSVYIMQSTYLMSCIWMTTLSYNVLLNFRYYLERSMTNKENKNSFKLYATWSYGMSALVLVLIWVMDIFTNQVRIYEDYGCLLFPKKKGVRYFFQLPIAVTLCVNMVLLLLAILEFRKRLPETKRPLDIYNEETFKFQSDMKLRMRENAKWLKISAAILLLTAFGWVSDMVFVEINDGKGQYFNFMNGFYGACVFSITCIYPKTVRVTTANWIKKNICTKIKSPKNDITSNNEVVPNSKIDEV